MLDEDIDHDGNVDADVEEDEVMGGSPFETDAGGNRSLRPRFASRRSLLSPSDDGDADDDAPVTRPPVQRRHRASASKRSKPGSTGPRRSSSLDFGNIRQALERTLKSQEWDETLLLLGTKELNTCLKQANYSKDQIAQLKVARRRAKNRTYALRSRQKKSGKQLAPCPGPTPGSVKSEPGVPMGDIAAPRSEDDTHAGAAAADMESDGAFEIEQLGHELALTLDDDRSHHSSEQWDTTSSYSEDFSIDGFTSSTSYDSSIDLLSSSMDSHGGSAAYAATFDAFGSLSLDAVPDYPAPPSDNFLRMVFANIPEDAETDAFGAAAPPASMALSPETRPASTELEALMSELRTITSGYDEVHKKLDNIAGEIAEPPRERIDTILGDAAVEPSGRTTPTPMPDGFQSLSNKISGWTSELGLPDSPDGKPSPSTLFDQATPLSTGGHFFTFDGPRARDEANAQAARAPHPLSVTSAMATTP